MPFLNDISVKINVDEVNESGETIRQPLREWGLLTLSAVGKVSAYIEPHTGKRFYVTIKPNIPYKYRSREWKRKTVQGQSKTRSQPCKKEDFGKIKEEPSDDIDMVSSLPTNDDRVKIKQESEDDCDTKSFPPVLQSNPRHPDAPPYDLLASVYLDGWEKPERQSIVYLDRYDLDYPDSSHGEIKMSTRLYQSRDGQMRELSWVFRDVGIEAMFDKLQLCAEDSNGMGQDEEDLVKAMNSTNLQDASDFQKEGRKPGQILVTFERIVTVAKYRDPQFRPSHTENEMMDINMEGADNAITHTAGFEEAHGPHSVSHKGVRLVTYNPYIPGEKTFATFVFFYRSSEILAKMNLRSSKPNKKKRQEVITINDTISLTTPLGTSRPSPNAATGSAKSSPKRKTVTFNDNVVAYSEDNPADVAVDSIEPPDRERPLKRRESTTSLTFNSSGIAHSSTTGLSDSLALAHRLSKERYNLRPATINRFNSPRSTYSPQTSLKCPFRPSEARLGLFRNKSLSPPRSQRATSSANDSIEGSLDLTQRCSFLKSSTTPASSSDGTPAKHARQQKSALPFRFSAGGFRKGDHYASDAEDERDSNMTEDHDTWVTSSPQRMDTAENEKDEATITGSKNDEGLSVGMNKLMLGKRDREEEEEDMIDNETHRVNVSRGQEAEPQEKDSDCRNESKLDNEKKLESPEQDGKEDAAVLLAPRDTVKRQKMA